MSETTSSRTRGERKRRCDAGVRLVDRDLTILAWISETYASVTTLADVTNSSAFAIRNRLSRLARAGYVTGIKGPLGAEKVWLPTQDGLKALNAMGGER